MKKTLYRLPMLLALPGLLLLLAYQTNYFEINKQLEIFNSVYREVHLNYVDETEPGHMMETAIESMLSDLDPYTNFIPERAVEDFRSETSGHYGGIGANVGSWSEYITITQVSQGYAADKAGIKPGDQLVEADGVNLKGKAENEVIDLLKGSPGSKVNLKVKRGDQVLSFTLERQDVQVKAVPYFTRLEGNIGYILLSTFNEKASREVRAALEELSKEPLEGLVLDLRGNPGGLLSEAVNIVGLFVPKGTEVVSTRGRLEEVRQTFRTLDQPVARDLPLTVVINRGSASASEIVAGTLQDLDRAVVVGQRSFGKGLVQQTRPLAYGAQLKVTVSKYYTPSGRCIQAINYAERAEDGSVERVPDSLRTAFKTRNGRTVLDGGGIDPDIRIEEQDFPEVLRSLVISGKLFDWVTAFARTNPAPDRPQAFRITEEQYRQFVEYASGNSQSYQPETELLLNDLGEAAVREGYEEQLGAELETLKQKFSRLKRDDMNLHREVIQRVLEEEAVSRYFYQEGHVALGISKDPEILKAREVLSDQEAYASVFRKI